MNATKIIEVTPQNVHEHSFFCIRNIKSPGFESKRRWFEKRFKEGLQLKILKSEDDKMLGFIEFTPAEKAWRPVDASNYMFIHCIAISSKKDREQGFGSMLINEAEREAKKRHMDGLCVMTSKGAWMANKTVFEKNGFKEVDRRGRFELLSKAWTIKAAIPKLYDWTLQQKKYSGWNLVYADQCPWHEKSAFDLLNTAMDFGIDLKVTKMTSVEDAKQAPSGFGVFNLLYNGKLIEDHYISATRFKNILRNISKSV